MLKTTLCAVVICFAFPCDLVLGDGMDFNLTPIFTPTVPDVDLPGIGNIVIPDNTGHIWVLLACPDEQSARIYAQDVQSLTMPTIKDGCSPRVPDYDNRNKWFCLILTNDGTNTYSAGMIVPQNQSVDTTNWQTGGTIVAECAPANILYLYGMWRFANFWVPGNTGNGGYVWTYIGSDGRVPDMSNPIRAQQNDVQAALTTTNQFALLRQHNSTAYPVTDPYTEVTQNLSVIPTHFFGIDNGDLDIAPGPHVTLTCPDGRVVDSVSPVRSIAEEPSDDDIVTTNWAAVELDAIYKFCGSQYTYDATTPENTNAVIFCKKKGTDEFKVLSPDFQLCDDGFFREVASTSYYCYEWECEMKVPYTVHVRNVDNVYSIVDEDTPWAGMCHMTTPDDSDGCTELRSMAWPYYILAGRRDEVFKTETKELMGVQFPYKYFTEAWCFYNEETPNGEECRNALPTHFPNGIIPSSVVNLFRSFWEQNYVKGLNVTEHSQQDLEAFLAALGNVSLKDAVAAWDNKEKWAYAKWQQYTWPIFIKNMDISDFDTDSIDGALVTEDGALISRYENRNLVWYEEADDDMVVAYFPDVTKINRHGFIFDGVCVYDTETPNGENCSDEDTKYVSPENISGHNWLPADATGDKYVYVKWKRTLFNIDYDLDGGECYDYDDEYEGNNTPINLISVNRDFSEENNGITVTSRGDGAYTINGTATAEAKICIPMSPVKFITHNEGGRLALNNNRAMVETVGNTTYKDLVKLYFYETETCSDYVEYWNFLVKNRHIPSKENNNLGANDNINGSERKSFNSMAGKDIRAMQVVVKNGTEVNNLVMAPAFYIDTRWDITQNVTTTPIDSGPYSADYIYGQTHNCHPVIYNSTSDTDVTLPTSPHRKGYDFAGWYDGANKVETIPAGTEKDISVKVKWDKMCNLTCDAGTFLPAGEVECETCPQGFFCPGTETNATWCYDEDKDQGVIACKDEMRKDSATTAGEGSAVAGDCYVPCNEIDVDVGTLVAVGDLHNDANYTSSSKCKYIVELQYQKNVADSSCSVENDSCCPGGSAVEKIVNSANGYNKLTKCTPDVTEVCAPGKDFGGWVVQSITQTATDPVKNVVVYTPNCRNATYTIHYELDGGQCDTMNGDCAPSEYTFGTAATLPVAVKEGYHFAGWYDNSNNLVGSITATDHGNKTLYAKWDAICEAGTYLPAKSMTCKICEAVPDGQGYYCPGPTEQNPYYSYSDTTDQGKTACPPGYLHSLEGQATSESCNINFSLYPGAGTRFFNKSYSTESDKLVAIQYHWKESDLFRLDGGGVHYLKSSVFPGGDDAPTRKGYTFNGWLLQLHNEGTDYHRGDVSEAECSVAGLTRDANCNDSDNNCHNRGCKPRTGEATPCPVDFWYLGGLCIPPDKLFGNAEGLIDPDTPVTSGGQRNLYAKWTLNNYTITYDAAGGTCDENDSENLLSYQLAGWDTKDDDEMVTITSNGYGQYTISGNTANATEQGVRLWIPINEIVVPYAADAAEGPKGAGALALNNVAADEVLFQLYLGRKGQQWYGWKLNTSDYFMNTWKSGKIGIDTHPGGMRANYISIFVPKGKTLNNVTIKPALYNDGRTSASTFEAGRRFGCAEQKYNVEGGDVTLPIPTKEGYTFDGWWNGDKRVTKISAGTAENITLTAHWTPQQATVNFVCSPTFTYSVTNKLIGESIYWPTDSNCNNIEAETWDCSGNNWDIIPGATEEEIAGLIPRSVKSITCKPGYRIEYHNPPHDPSEEVNDEEIKVNGQPLNPRAYTSENRKYYPSEKTMNKIGAPLGFKFAGWYTDKELNYRVDRLSVSSSGKKIVYAKWDTVQTCSAGDGVETVETFITDDIVKCHVFCKDGYSRNGYHDTTTIFDTDKIERNTTVDCIGRTYKVNLDSRYYTSDDSDATSNSPTTTGTTEYWYRFKNLVGTNCYYFNKDITDASVENDSANCIPSPTAFTIPTYSGYTFGGYYASKLGAGTRYVKQDGSRENNIYITVPTDADKDLDPTGTSRTLYAKWTLVEYDVVYMDKDNANEWAAVPLAAGLSPVTYTVESTSEQRKLPGATVMTKAGYAFAGWYSNSELTGTPVESIANNATGTQTFYAKWTPKTISCEGKKYIAANSEVCNVPCPAGYYCPADNYEYTGEAQGKYSCAEETENEFTQSAAESEELTACYKDVETPCSELKPCPDHAICEPHNPASISGKQYYGQSQIDYEGASCVEPNVTDCDAAGWEHVNNTCVNHIKYKVKFMRCGATVSTPMGTWPNTGYIEYGSEHDYVLPGEAQTTYTMAGYGFTQWCKAKQVDSNTSACDGDDRFNVGLSTDVLVNNNVPNEETINICPDWQPKNYDIYYYNYMDADLYYDGYLYPTIDHYNVTELPKTLKSDVGDVLGYEFNGWCVYNEQQVDIKTASDCPNPKPIENWTVDAADVQDKYMYAKWTPKTISCGGKKYIAANSEECNVPCPAGYYCPADNYEYTGEEQGKLSCAEEIGNGFTKSAAKSANPTDCYKKCPRKDNAQAVYSKVYWSDTTEEQNDCEYVFNCDSEKWLRVGNDAEDKICLYENKPDGAALGVRVGTKIYYVPLSTDADVKINATSQKKLRIKTRTTTYNAHDTSESFLP